MKNIIIPFYWGADDKMIWKEKAATEAMRKKAVLLVNRMPKSKRLWEKSQSFKRYFSAYKRLETGKTYKNLDNITSMSLVWSFAVYIANIFSYDLMMLANDWHETMED